MDMPTSPAAEPGQLARDLLRVLDERRQIAPLTASQPGFDLAAAYRVTAAMRALREARGERVVGRKVGFTNTTIWAEYDVHQPIWGYVYDTTLHDLAKAAEPFPLAGVVEPRIEPEIVFGLAHAPEPGMDERALIGCVGWVAHGFELVQSLFPAWRFAAADTVAAFGLHGALLLGPRRPIEAREAETWLDGLARFSLTLACDGAVVDEGRADNVLGGGPLAALRHLVEVLAQDPASPALAAGEIISTGTVTRAMPIAPGERWTTDVKGLDLAGIGLTLV